MNSPNSLAGKQAIVQRANEPIPVTVVIPIKNQADALARCLCALEEMTAVVVVDSKSTDNTEVIAKSWGAEVLQFEWKGGFPKKRNWVLQSYAFNTDWVLFLDADEVLTPRFISELRGELPRSRVVGYWLRYNNFFQGRPLHFGVPQRKLALFRVGAGFYERIDDPGWSDLDMEVHEHPILEGPIGEIKNPILHEDFSPLSKFIERHDKYSSWEARRYLADFADQAKTRNALTFRQRVKYLLLESPLLSVLYFIYTYFFRAGLLDGRAGLHYARYKAMYFYDISRKIKGLRKAKPARITEGMAPTSNRD